MKTTLSNRVVTGSILSLLLVSAAIGSRCSAAPAFFPLVTDAGTSSTNKSNANLVISHGPFLQAPSDTEVTVSFASSIKGVGWVEYKEVGSDKWLTNFPARHGLVAADNTFHNVRLTGLLPAKSYVYRAVCRELVKYAWPIEFGDMVSSREHKFKTLDPGDPSMSFVVVSDRHERQKDLRASWAQVNWTNIDLAILNGDMVNSVRSDQLLYDAVIDPSTQLFAHEVPLLYVRGNHETRGPLARALLDFFPTPSGTFYHSFKLGPVAFLALDCGEDKVDNDQEYQGLSAFRPYMEEQLAWLEKEIRSEEFRKAPFRICLLHIPPRDLENPRFTQPKWLANHVVPVLNKGKVDLMISGHVHKDEVRPAVADGPEFPVIISGARTVLQFDVTKTAIHVSRMNLDQQPLPEVPVIRRR